MSIDTTEIVSLTQQIIETIRPEFTGVDIEMSPNLSCERTEGRTDKIYISTRGVQRAPGLIQSIAHGVTHHQFARYGTQGLTKSSYRHSTAFQETETTLISNIYDELGIEKIALLDMHIQKALARKPRHERTAYIRVTLACPQCRHTLTIRETAAEKTVVMCREHMTVMEEKK